ncbi:hypothetical protein DEO23_12215 [Brachybacterium endophyticum]|uniref:Uncharacterized protein n=1 Tax=Brachybacterium endophyticum TaxID=2182385 RepID=A0A2U2RHP5_9MICO|nr:hypothetical protein [Brachybacterium endophyticum]PWH05351.1 hypothetical protein DEO23_12215 [Brachybacterium endophyticum]
MHPSPAWRRARTATILLALLTVALSAISWTRDGALFDTGVGLALTAALAAFVVFLYYRSQARSLDRD